MALKKIAILTQPLFTNYGGFLQAYALQSTLERLGNKVEIIRRDPPYLSLRFPNNVKLEVKYLIKRLLSKPCTERSASQNKLITKNVNRFIKRYLNVSESLYTDNQLISYTKKHHFDAFVVGSDQVWRPAMSPNIYNFYLDFVSEQPIKKLAYAASFGVDKWEYTSSEQEACCKLVKQFDAISVREATGVDLCREYLGVVAVQVLDPTFLLSSKDYEQLAVFENEPKRDGDLFCYVLDKSDEKKACIDAIKAAMGYHDYYCMPRYSESPDNIARYKDLCIFPSVTSWIRSLMDAKMVVTDSFHGTAFSIIFNKPFWVIGNKARGLSRFESILGLFDLQDRLIVPPQKNDIDWAKPIDWESVNEKKREWQGYSLEFIKSVLK